MAARRMLVSASILDADLADLESESRRALKAGSDRLLIGLGRLRVSDVALLHHLVDVVGKVAAPHIERGLE